MKKLLLFIFVFVSISNLLAQDDYLITLENSLANQTKEDSLYDFQQTVTDIKTILARKNFSGRANFGFNGVTTRDEDNSLFNIFGGINLDWELYPGELNFYTSFGVTITDGQVQENVSRIDISYDYIQSKVGNGLILENYVYINRSTDVFLGIDQRYEMGGGLIINNWIKKLNTPANNKLPVSIAENETEWESILINAEVADIDALKTDYREAYNKNRRAGSRLRTALLAGLFFELQQTTINDSIELGAEQHFRWVLRPTFDLKLRDGWNMSLRSYFKMPMPWEWKDVVSDELGNKNARADMLIDFTARLTTQLASKRVEVGFIYSVIYDNAAPRIFLTSNDGNTQFVKNNDLHQSFRMSVSVNLAK